MNPNSKTILVVEDDMVSQMIAEHWLTLEGFQVHTAMSGLDAIEKVKLHNFDLILMDINMPMMGGLEATRKIREMPNRKETPIVALTAHTDRSQILEFKNAGMNDHLEKPFDPEKLKSVTERFLC